MTNEADHSNQRLQQQPLIITIGCRNRRLQQLELKLANEKKSPKVKVSKDSLADLQKKMGRLTAEVLGDDRSPGKGKTKASKKADAKNVSSAQD
ncbi:Uncharacterized protein TCM_005235 [Theobroma cacao]|uniref:Uncharacterized protein n=1 Tax=Theobroma cacao TaxID=3641 RepID=A0A061DTV7_THECC|nr:Uncharacterized protein TCM_005235 [Theobroma cacao]